MNKPFDYIAEANVTASNNFHGSKVPLLYFQGIVANAINALKQLDEVKKSLFYGRDLNSPSARAYQGTATSALLPSIMDEENAARGELLIHSIVGTATEAGELLELLEGALFHAKPFDVINFVEEVGDGFWYAAVGLGAVDSSFEAAQRINIAKLRHRFPEKFTEYEANNRDLFGERKILEGGVDSIAPGGCAPNVHAIAYKPTVRIENWIFTGNVLFGDVTNHPHMGDAKDVRTSIVLNFDEVNGIAETKNTIYRLGKKYETLPASDAANQIVDTLK